MEILKQIFPYNLNGPEFLLFYGALLSALAIYSYIIYSKHVQATFKNDVDNLHINNPYELAYLQGGENTFYELIISELIEDKRLIPIEDGYEVNKNINSNNPISAYLETLGKDKISLDQLYEVAQSELTSVKDRYASFIEGQKTEKFKPAILLIVVYEILGLIRIYQGLSNDKPVEFLILLMIVGIIFIYALHIWPLRKKKAATYFKYYWEELRVELTPFQKRLLTNGFSSICYGTALYHLYPFFNSINSKSAWNNNSIYDDFSSCGSDCSSCGSDCGGCGGCGD